MYKKPYTNLKIIFFIYFSVIEEKNALFSRNAQNNSDFEKRIKWHFNI